MVGEGLYTIFMFNRRIIGQDYKDKHSVVVIGVMKGGFMFTAGEGSWSRG